MNRISLAVVSLGFTLLLSSRAIADTYTMASETDYDDIALVTNTSVNNRGLCASTSIINSFSYLEAAYPSVYNTLANPYSLTQGVSNQDSADLATVRNNFDATIAAPRLQGNVYNAKISWVNMYAPGTTTIAAVTNQSATSAQGSVYPANSANSNVQYNQTGAQMWTWLVGQLQAGEDVELGMYNHMTTVMGYAIDNQTGGMYLEIIDPNSPNPGGNGQGPGANGNGAAGEWVNATYNMSGMLTLSGFSVADYTNPNVYYMFAESPVPEPAMVVSIGSLSVIGLILLARRKTTPSFHLITA